ncbi:glycosyltransferase family 4 protein [Candidatus Gracilibacteria bacterium]|nr:glycosyltransferase family 4 protein [Candidatus Gracilibacteria bacterium]
MKIFIPFEIKDIGGTATFAQKFSDTARSNSVEVSNKFSLSFDTLFIVADCSLWYPIIAKVFKKRIVQRLDGVYHPATPAGKWYPLYNLKMQIIHNFLADVVIYQSEFSKVSCETFLGRTRAGKTTIIYNGVDTEKIPSRITTQPEDPTVKLLTFAKFRRRDQIEPIIESVKLLDPKKYVLHIFGSYTENLETLFSNLPPSIIFHGKKPNEELLQILHQYDLFLFSDQSACPNSVLEAMAAGLPVVAFDRGSINEIIKNDYNGYSISLPNTNPFQNPYPFNKSSYEQFSDAIQKSQRKINSLREQSVRDIKEQFDLRAMTHAYLKSL